MGSFCALVLTLAFALVAAATAAAAPPLGARVYATLLYSDDFDVAVRVLGASLEASRAAHPRACMYTEHVGAATVQRLAADGWHMLRVPTIDLPPTLQAAKFRYIYSKLRVWALDAIGVERVVFLDADVLVRHNVDHLFECGPEFCAAQRLENYFNAGVLVLRTNSTLYDELVARAAHAGRHAGEQTLLNEAFGPRLRNGTFFGPRGNEGARAGSGALRGGGSPTHMQELAFSYNADPLLYALSGNRWKMPWDVSELGENDPDAMEGPHLVHYSGPFKPWHWTSYLLFAELWEWHAVRARLRPAESALYAPSLEVARALLFVLAALAAPFAGARARALARHGRAPPLQLLVPVIHVLALVLAAGGVGAHATPHWGAAQCAALYGVLLAFAHALAALSVDAAYAEAALLFALLEAFFAWRAGYLFLKVGILALALLAQTHVAAQIGARADAAAAAATTVPARLRVLEATREAYARALA
jgi:hypothetical protein